jgi:hypothetical protein
VDLPLGKTLHLPLDSKKNSKQKIILKDLGGEPYFCCRTLFVCFAFPFCFCSLLGRDIEAAEAILYRCLLLLFIARERYRSRRGYTVPMRFWFEFGFSIYLSSLLFLPDQGDVVTGGERGMVVNSKSLFFSFSWVSTNDDVSRQTVWGLGSRPNSPRRMGLGSGLFCALSTHLPVRFLIVFFFCCLSLTFIYLPYICKMLPSHHVLRIPRGLERCASVLPMESVGVLFVSRK